MTDDGLVDVEYMKTEEMPTLPVGPTDIDRYMNMTYRVVAKSDLGAFTVTCPELPGCSSHGDTLEHALASFHDAKAKWIEERLAKGMTVPEPK